MYFLLFLKQIVLWFIIFANNINNMMLQIIKKLTIIILLATAPLLIKAQQKNILVIHSYHSGLSWTDNINKGIYNSFVNEQNSTVDIRCEYMDTKHFEDSAHFTIFKNYIKNKYQGIKIDLLICSDNAAFNFLTINAPIIFPNIPVLFCAVNYCDSIPQNFTGIIEDIDIKLNIETILNLHPNYNKIYIINDKSITGTSITKEFNTIIDKHFNNLRYEYLTDYTLDELKLKLTTLNKNDVVFMLLFNFDRLNNTYSYDVILDILNPYISVPVYGTWDFYFGKGIVGGNITGAYTHGVMVSNMAKQILNGTNISQIPVKKGPTQLSFDYKILKKHNISKFKLPNNSTIINQPFSFIRNNKIFFIYLTIVLIIMLVLIITLWLQVKKVKQSLKKEKKLLATVEAKSAEIVAALEIVEQSNKLKDAFLANISHEIRTPMNGILGFIELLKIKNLNTNEKAKYIDIIETSGYRLLNTINDIIEISKIESNQITIHQSEINLNDILNYHLNFFKPIAQNKGLQIKISEKITTKNAIINSDKNIIDNILTNLINNAIKYTHNGSVNIGTYVENNWVIFYVKDTGIGIPANRIESIFERFVQVDTQAVQMQEGSGLGLSIVKGYVNALQGKVWVNSEPGIGSTFFFSIPYNPVYTNCLVDEKNTNQ